MAQSEHLPIYRAAFDLAVWMEKTVRHFPKYHKYTLGSEMRDLSRMTLRLVCRANSRTDRVSVLLEIRETVEDLKVVIRLAKEVEAFANLNSFEYATRQVVAIARQNEGWIKHEKKSVGYGQNRPRAEEFGSQGSVP